jgi:hypothetical protein
VFLSMLLKDRIVDFAKDFFTKGILQLNPTKFLIAKHFFIDFYLSFYFPEHRFLALLLLWHWALLTDICQMMMVSMSRCTVCYIYAISCPKILNLSILYLLLEFPKIAPTPCILYLWTKKLSNRDSSSICGFYTHKKSSDRVGHL